MRKITILTSGCILLIGVLFYGWSLKNQPASEAPVPKAVLVTKLGKTTAIVPTAPATHGASPVSPTENSPLGQIDPEVETGEAGVKPRHFQTAPMQEANQRSTGNRTYSNSKSVKDPAPLDPEKPDQSQAPMGIRLAPDVRLPVAAMPLDFKISPVAKTVLDQIVADYYREIASPPPSKDQNRNDNPTDSTSTDLIEESETGELTRVITNGPAVDEARKRADARFKALFGFQAYNRMTMNTLLEARLPVPPEE